MSAGKWVTFDCYGTLMDWQTGFRRIVESIAGSRTDELIRAYHRAEAEAETKGSQPFICYKEVLTLTLRRAAQTIGLPIDDEQAGVLVRSWSSLPIFNDTGPALEALRKEGWQLGILTNCDDDLFAQTRAGLPVPIDWVVTAEQVKSYKPGLAHFQAFEQKCGVDRDRWVHAAVSWWHDMEPARTLGIRRVWVDRENSGHDRSTVTARVLDMASLPAMIATLGVS